MANKPTTPWNSLEVTKLIVSALTPVLLFAIGYKVNQWVREGEARAKTAENQRQEQAAREQALRDRADLRQQAVRELSTFVYERRVRAEMLSSALQRNAAQAELMRRKELYDESYVKWNSHHQANLLGIRQLLESKEYSQYEELMEFHLVQNIFRPLDACLTAAYDERLRGESPVRTLAACNARLLIQRALDCGYAFTDTLFRLSALSEDRAAEQAARAIIEQRCQ
jgi:hypothetical protein